MQGIIYAPASAGTDEDLTLIRRCQNGDVNAFSQLVTRHEKKVYALVARVLGATATPDDVADTAQDVFVQAWRALGKFRGDARFSTWLYRIATNMAIKEWHRRKRRGLFVYDDAPIAETDADPSPGPAALAHRRADNAALRRAIDALPEKQRTVVLLHYFEDLACEEIASVVGVSVGTIWSRLHYACKKLRDSVGWLGQP